MLKSADSLGLKPLVDPKWDQRRLGWLVLGLYATLSLIWGFWVDAPWDDDCPTRFLNTRNAFGDPENFVSVWNRPLFVLIFALPAQLGKVSVPILMTAISTLGAWLLWRAADTLKAPNAWLVIALYAFQPFFFGTSRVALTEPLAATLIAAGFFFLVRKQWGPYALMGGLLPLARLEMSVVLLIWLWPLVQQKQWKGLVWMVVPFALWNIAGGLFTGDFLYVFTQTFGVDKGVNRYGQTTFWHYFEHYFYVTGPVAAMLLGWGLVLRLRSKSAQAWIDGQFVLGFLVYVVFSWKLSVGNAAGFLRNLVPLTPLVALIALDGFNRAVAILTGSTYEKRPKELKLDRIILGVASAVVLLLTFQYFSKKMVLHHHIIPEPDFSLLAAMGLMLVLGGAILAYKRPSAKANEADRNRRVHGIAWSLAMAFALITTGFTLVKEPPGVSDNPERQGIGIIAKFYKDSEFRNLPTYVNHNWFFWAADLNSHDPQFQRVTTANLQKAPVGSVVVWDVHYSTRLEGDVMPQTMYAMPQFVELLRVGHPARHECVILYQNVGPDSLAQANRSRQFSEANPKFLPAITARAYYLMDHRQYRAAIDRFDFALANVKNDPDLWYGRGYCLMEMGYYTEAIGDLQKAVSLVSRFPVAWHHLGVAQSQTGDLKSALISLNRSILLNDNSFSAFYTRGSVKASMHDLEGAVADYTATLQLNPNHVDAYSNRAAAYSMLGQVENARADIARAAAMTPGNPKVIFIQGRIELQANNKPTACELMRKAYEMGLKEAEKFISKHCDSIPAIP